MGLGATYDVHLRLIGKLVGDFLLVIIELFSLGAFVLSQCTRLTDRRTDRQTSIATPCVCFESHGKKTRKINPKKIFQCVVSLCPRRRT